MSLQVASGETVTKTLEAHRSSRELFEVVVTQDQVENSKPAPDLFLEAAKRLGVEPSKCLVIEDGQLGIQAAEAAGMHSILIEGG